MGKHWARQQVKRNEIQDFLDSAFIWISANRQIAGGIAGAVLLLIMIVSLTIYRGRTVQATAWDRLALAQNFAYGGRIDEALSQINDLAADYARTKAYGFGLLFAGDMLYPRGEYKEAQENYAKLLDSGEPKTLQPFALSAMAITQESAGQFQQAVQTAQRFLDTHPDHFLAAQVNASLARSQQALGQNDQAKATFQKIIIQYPDTSWAAWAQAQGQGR
ncbi:MAG: hypothetical protein A3J70_07320 [Elusimicrobia bacterium RIFCSPHIGHO2_02_FULL_61_10]|nr:MAG: hypothetical protein A3J70_07320 [Elusimicrobia bacterium RIFCSPHIGHO2_02_FULL_61_10]